MQTIYNVGMVLAIVVAILFTVVVLVTGKGDGMSSGGSGIRTTFKGRTTVDEQIGKFTLILGGVYMGLMIILDVLATRVFK
jgi:protein translocase SecG subunit